MVCHPIQSARTKIQKKGILYYQELTPKKNANSDWRRGGSYGGPPGTEGGGNGGGDGGCDALIQAAIDATSKAAVTKNPTDEVSAALAWAAADAAGCLPDVPPPKICPPPPNPNPKTPWYEDIPFPDPFPIILIPFQILCPQCYGPPTSA